MEPTFSYNDLCVITLQSVKRSECPRELFPPDRRTEVHLDLVKRDENYKSPTTSIQLRLADGTRMVSHFNLHHTVGDVRAFIVASRPGEASNFHLQTMGFPPRKLDNPDQTIQDAGIANSVVIQKF
ncbi:Plant UBX domain-containing protein 5 [Linum perenne]